jgi:hypothetical protein
MATYAWAVVGSHRFDSNECRHRGDLGISPHTGRTLFDTALRSVTSCLRTMKHLLQVMQKGRFVVGCCRRRIC